MLAIAPAVLYAITVNVVPFAYSFGASAILVLALRFSTNIAFASVISLGKPQSKTVIQSSERLALFVISIALIGQTYGMLMALKSLPVSVAITIFFTFPILSYFIEQIKKRTRPHLVAIAALLTSLIGVWLMTSTPHSNWNVQAIWWPLLSSVLQATIQGLAESVHSVRGWKMVKITSIVPAVIFVAMAASEAQSVSLFALIWAFVAATGFCLAMYFLFVSVRINGALRSANMLYLEPIMAIPISLTIHHDTLSLLQYVGIALIALGCFVIEWRERRSSFTSQENVTAL